MPIATVVDADTLPVMLTWRQVQAITGLSRPKVYELLNTQGCPVVRFGRAIRVMRDPFFLWLRHQAGVEEES